MTKRPNTTSTFKVFNREDKNILEKSLAKYKKEHPFKSRWIDLKVGLIMWFKNNF